MSLNTKLDLVLSTRNGDNRKVVEVSRLIVAGWTGRDKEAMEHHIRELEELGIARPASTPVFYRNSAARLTTRTLIQVPGESSSGEVEFVLFNIDGDIWVGVGSDHTDREAETYNITLSKQACDKPIADTLWPLAELEDHWDELAVNSEIEENGQTVTYQQGTVAAMLGARDLIREFENTTGETFGPGDAMMGGTLAAIGGIRPSARFSFSLQDKKAGRRLSHEYAIQSLSIAG